MSEAPLRVLLIDDHTLFRSGLQELLERRGIDVVAAVGDGQQGCRMAAELRPDVVLLDLRMPQTDGFSTLDHLVHQGTTAPIAILTTSCEEQDLIRSLRAGACGYLTKDMEPDRLIESLREIVSGKTVIAPEMTHVLAKVVQGDDVAVPEGKTKDRFSALTPREMEILCLVAAGQSNKMIARSLGITEGTAKLHVRSILRKLNARSRVEAAVLAVEEGVCHGTTARSDS